MNKTSIAFASSLGVHPDELTERSSKINFNPEELDNLADIICDEFDIFKARLLKKIREELQKNKT